MKRIALSICAGLFLALASCGDDEPAVVDAPAAQSEEDDEFEVLDANDDEFLDVDEIPENEGREVFLAWDTDRNAVLDRDEIHGTAFKLWDINRDGRISEAEWTQNADVWYSRPVVEAFADWDNDGDSELDADEFSERFDLSAVGDRWAGETLEEAAFKDAYFELYDANNDGRVSRLEWQTGKAIWGTAPE